MKKTNTPKIVKPVDTNFSTPTANHNTKGSKSSETFLQSEKRYRELFANSLMAISIVDLDGNLVQANEAYARMYGYESAQEMLDLNVNVRQFYASPYKRSEVLQYMHEDKNMEAREIEVVRRDGTHIFVLVSASVIHDESGKPVYYQANHIDITERKNLEKDLNENETLFTTLFHYSPIPISLSEIDTENWIEVNEAFLKVTGYSRHEVIGHSFRDINLWKNIADREKMRSLLKSQGYIKSFEVEINKKDGSSGTMLISVEIVKISDKPYMLISGNEVTEIKHAEAALKQSNELFTLYLQHSPLYTYIKEVTSTESRVVVASKNFADMIGVDASEMVGKTMEELFPKEFAAQMTADDWNVIANEKELNLEENLNNRNYYSIKFPIKLGGKKMLAGYTIDITEQKKAEETLRKSEELFRQIFEYAIIGKCTIGTDGKFQKANKAMQDIFGYSEAELQKLTFNDVTYPEDISTRNSRFDLLINGKLEKVNFEKRYLSKSGKIIWGLVSTTAIMDSENKAQYLISQFVDITERKQVEEALKLSEARLTRAELASLSGNWELHLDSNLVISSEGSRKVYGIEGEQMDYEAIKEFTMPEYRLVIDNAFKNLIKHNKPYNLDFKIKKANTGEIRNIHSEATFDKEKQIVFGIIQDITERKMAEATFNDIIEKNPMSIQIVDAEGHTLMTNPANTLLFGSPPPPDFSIFGDLQKRYPHVKKHIELAKSGQVVHLPDILYNTHDISPELPDNPKWIRAIIFPLKDSAGKPERFVLMHEDITEHKRADEQVINLNRTYALISEINQMIVRIDNRDDIFKLSCRIAHEVGKFKMAWIGLVDNKTKELRPYIWDGEDGEYLKKIKISVEDVPEGRGPSGVVMRKGKHIICNDIENDPVMHPWRKEALKRGYRSSIALPIVVKGKVIAAYTLYANVPEFFDDKEIELLDDVAKDISFALEAIEIKKEREQAKEALKDSESKYQFIVENTDDLLWTMNADLKFEYISPSVTKLMGYTVDEHIKHTLDDFLTPESAQMVKEEFINGMIHLKNKEYQKLRDRADLELEYIRKDKSTGYGFTSMIMERDKQYQLKKIRGRTFDITERKLIEKYNEMGREVLQILNEPTPWQQSIEDVLAALKKGTEFSAVGIRLQNGDDYPYYAQQGFSEEFIKTENSLKGRTAGGMVCVDKAGNASLECTCGLVISGKTNPNHPLFTKGGSFWVNNSYPLLEIPPEEDPRLRPRNICIHQGYASFALIPLKNHERIIGLIQLNDKRKDRFTLNSVQMLEGIASHIETAMRRKQAEEDLQIKMDELMRFHHLTVGRELKMIELKKEINTLLKQLGMEEKYNIVDE